MSPTSGPHQPGDFLDVTVPIRPGMFVYPGDPAVHLERVSSIAGGDPSNLSRIDLGVHTGTHIDAPVHFLDRTTGAESIPLEPLIGPAFVADATSVADVIDAEAIELLGVPDGTERLLFKTTNSDLWQREAFSPDFVKLSASAARALVDRGVRLVGVDYLSVGDEEVHRVLLEARVVPLEGLDLRGVQAGNYRLICLPLKIEGSDGAPARVLLERSEESSRV